jgi:hypothetical protein
MTELARFNYTDTALPLAAATVTIFNTVNSLPGGQWLAQWNMKRVIIDIFNDQAGTLNWFKSRGHRGATSALTTWDKVGTAAVPIVAAGATNSFDIAIPMYEECKVEFVVGGVNTGVFDVDVVLSDEINKQT